MLPEVGAVDKHSYNVLKFKMGKASVKKSKSKGLESNRHRVGSLWISSIKKLQGKRREGRRERSHMQGHKSWRFRINFFKKYAIL